MAKVVVNHTSIMINDYDLGDKPILEKSLSLWDSIRHCYIPKGYMYDETKRILYVPRGIDISYIERLFNTTAEINYTPDNYDKISVKIKTMPKDNGQRRAVGFLTGEGNFKYTQKYPQLLLNLPPGEGKTVISTMAISVYGLKTMVITHIDKIRQQWVNTLVLMTDLTHSDICIIDGSSVIKKLMKSDKNKYKVYLVNHGTILSYAKSNGWDSIRELFKHLKIGLKIIDEAHLNFDNIVKTDMFTNTKKTFYLTATFERSDHEENALFNKCFKNVVRFTLQDTSETKRKHTVYLSVLYNSRPSIADQAKMYGIKGFNKIEYSNYQLKCDKFYDALLYVIKYFESKEGKILILSTKIDIVDSITEFLNIAIENKKIDSYHSKVDPSIKDDILIYSDIISSTSKSAGTGLDIAKLRTVIMTEAYSSKVQAEQASGRLREYAPDEYTFYVELVDIGFQKVYDMYKRRLPVFKKKCVKVLTMDISKQGGI